MTEREKQINDIISEFDMEMRFTDRLSLMYDIVSSNPPTPQEALRRSKCMGKPYDDQRAALRHALDRFLPSDSQLAEQLRPAAEKALEDAARMIEKEFKK